MSEGAPPHHAGEHHLLSRVALGVMCGLGVLVVLLISLRDDRPEPLTVGVVDEGGVLQDLDVDDALTLERSRSAQDARQRLTDGEVSALVLVDDDASAVLIVKEPPSPVAADRIVEQLEPRLVERGLEVEVDPEDVITDDGLGGRSPFLAAVALALGGTLAAAAVHSRLVGPLQRLAGTVAVVVVLGAATAVALIPTGLYDDVAVGVALVAMLAAGASAAVAAALFASIGRSAGLAVSLTTVSVATAVTGGTVPTQDLPPMWRALDGALPVGAGRDALVALTWFSAAKTVGPVTVLLVYTLLGLAVVLVASRLRGPDVADPTNPPTAETPPEAEEPADLPPAGAPPRRAPVERDGPAPQPEPGRVATAGPFLFGTRNGGEPLPRRVPGRERAQIVRRNGHGDDEDGATD
ncbi:MAG: hypothetical protein S0880_08160 [Actinomycetota bacterium]|nr:hypothetical protein [Actinomycetota bacterium]